MGDEFFHPTQSIGRQAPHPVRRRHPGLLGKPRGQPGRDLRKPKIILGLLVSRGDQCLKGAPLYRRVVLLGTGRNRGGSVRAESTTDTLDRQEELQNVSVPMNGEDSVVDPDRPLAASLAQRGVAVSPTAHSHRITRAKRDLTDQRWRPERLFHH